MYVAVLADDKTIQQSTGVLRRFSEALSGNSFWILVLSVVIALLIGKILSILLRRVSRTFGHRADASVDLAAVNRFRRIETWTILSIAIVRTVLFVLGLYFWWEVTHPGNSGSSALVGASALLAIIIGGVLSPLLRDFAFGSSMMAEHWFGVGDLISMPFPDVQGVVERITLRSTRIRGLNGEVIWVSNQNISAVRIAQKGVWTVAIELFVTDPKKGEVLVERVNQLLPTGPALLASSLTVMSSSQRSENLWHLTAIGETAPGREWIIERTALDLLKKLDEESPERVLITDPVARYADNETERQFVRAVKNAKKTRRSPRRVRQTKEK